MSITDSSHFERFRRMLDKQKLKQIHSIRGMAAIYVVIYHAKFILWSGGTDYLKNYPLTNWNFKDYLLFAADMASSAGYEMVILFFVLSGFFIAYSFKIHAWTTRDFIKNRIIRVYPPYIVSALLAIVLLRLDYLISPDSFSQNTNEYFQRLPVALHTLNVKSIFYSLFFIPNKEYIGANVVYWSLLYESIFYIIAPLVIRFYKLYFLVSVAFFLFLHGNNNPFVTFLTTYSIYFSIGIVLFHFVHIKPVFDKIKSVNNVLIIASIFLLLGGVVFLSLINQKTLSSLLVSLLCCFMIVIFSKKDFRTNRFSQFIIGLGVISYSIYLIHYPLLMFFHTVYTKFTSTYVIYDHIYWLAMIPVFLLAKVFYRYIESPFLLLNKRIAH